ncbi:hypothetical protein BREVNS_1657 [Brevinematales bacterium NS]|nr:hypothetical protein BREVNS_1657 [Brevinematales bacterium NS]
MKRGKYIYIFTIFLAMIVGSCSLLLGPLSRLSLEALVSGEWKWEWVGEWSGYEINFNYPRSIKTYVLGVNEKPGFAVYYNFYVTTLVGWYIHITPKGELQEIMHEVGTYNYPLSDPLHCYVDPEQKEVTVFGANITNSSISLYGGVFSYNLINNSRKGVWVGAAPDAAYLLRAIPVGKTLFFQTNSYSVAKWNIESGDLQIFQGWGSTLKSIFPIKADKAENALLLFITNDTYATNYAAFYDQTGNEKPEMRMSFMGWVGSNWIGTVGEKGVYMLISPKYPYNIYHLFAFQNGSWEDKETKEVVVPAIDKVLGIDIMAIGGIIAIAWLVEPTTVVVSFYEETKDSLTKISEKTLSVSPEKGSIEGINLFYDRAGHRLFLGVLHAVPPDNHVGVSYFWLPWL